AASVKEPPALACRAVPPIIPRPEPLRRLIGRGLQAKGVSSLPDRYFQHTFPNGLTLLAEKMPGVQSAAMTFLVPAGSSTDPVDRSGSATVLSDLVLRGAGSRDNRQLTDYLDSLGLQRSSSVGVHHTRFGAAALAPRVEES